MNDEIEGERRKTDLIRFSQYSRPVRFFSLGDLLLLLLKLKGEIFIPLVEVVQQFFDLDFLLL